MLHGLSHPGSVIIHTGLMCTEKLKKANLDVRVFCCFRYPKLKAEMGLGEGLLAESAD